MKVIGVTGKYCSGKSYIAEQLVQQGFTALDIDQLGHTALGLQSKEIIARFGEQICAPDGSIDRKKLGAIVFADSEQLLLLESITHPIIKRLCLEKLAEFAKQSEIRGVVIHAALLSRLKLDALCDVIVFVKASRWLRKKRAKERDGFSGEAFRARERNQRDIALKKLYNNRDVYVILSRNESMFVKKQLESFLCSL